MTMSRMLTNNKKKTKKQQQHRRNSNNKGTPTRNKIESRGGGGGGGGNDDLHQQCYHHHQHSSSSSSYCCPCPLLPLVPSKKNMKKYEIAVVACGSFWNPQRRFERMDGVKRVVVGYTGGKHRYPNFQNKQDHTQALFIEYNPKKVSYTQILEMWNQNDDPWTSPYEEEGNEGNFDQMTLSCRSALFVLNEYQQSKALEFVLQLSQTRPHSKLFVDIEQAQDFYQAEEYQQQYVAKQCKAAREQFLKWANDEAPTGLFPILE